MLDELAQRFPGDPLIDEKRAAIGARREGRAPATPREQGAIPGGVSASPADPARARSPGSASPSARTRARTATSASPTSRWASTTRPSPSSSCCSRTRPRAVFALTMIGECVEAKGELGEAVGKYKEALNLSQVTSSESLELYYLLGLGVRTAGRRPRGALLLREPPQARRQLPRRRSAHRRPRNPQAPARPDHVDATSPRRSRRRSSSSICRTASRPRIEAADGGGRFREDAWTRPTGGGGRTRVLADGRTVREGGRRVLRRARHAAARDGARAARRGRQRFAPPASR